MALPATVNDQEAVAFDRVAERLGRSVENLRASVVAVTAWPFV